ncbi:unnamed protein product [Mytilus coruscus]|uniref:Uncharacterized protein n=1 Tax=Mytilus coruscus TaxID=42192 RepID=A0A6J8B2J8_MYTCO|nr:unnamed protein product [Mytilus coruscus]
MREIMTKLILQKVDAQIDQLNRELMPVQSTITSKTTLNSNNDEAYIKRQIYTSTNTARAKRRFKSNSGTNPLEMNATHQPPKYQHHVSQPSKYYTPGPRGIQVTQHLQHQCFPDLNNSNVSTSGRSNSQDRVRHVHGYPLIYRPTEMPAPVLSNYKDQNVFHKKGLINNRM